MNGHKGEGRGRQLQRGENWNGGEKEEEKRDKMQEIEEKSR